MEQQGDPLVEQEKQRQPQENAQKELRRESPSGWRYYSPTPRSIWPPTRWLILATIAAIVASVSLSLIGARWGEIFSLIGAIGPITLVGIGMWKAKRLLTLWNAIRVNAALAGVLTALLAAVFGLGGVLYQQHVAAGIADKQRQETQVQTYFDDMGELLLDTDQPLREAEPGDDVSVLAQAKTLTVLEALDSEHKKSIVRFLYNAQLIRKDSPVVSLQDANLQDADLRNVSLMDTDLSGANLHNANLAVARLNGADLSSAVLSYAVLSSAVLEDADLSGAILEDADLGGARLEDARLNGAILFRADLSSARGITSEELEKQARSLKEATMPDGSTHE